MYMYMVMAAFKKKYFVQLFKCFLKVAFNLLVLSFSCDDKNYSSAGHPKSDFFFSLLF